MSGGHHGENRSRGGGQQRGDWEVGDWVCPSCRAINFKRRSSCLKCGVGKPEAFEQAVPYAPLGDGKKASNKKSGAKGDEMWCELCQIECPGQASYSEHCRGKKHRAALRAMQGESEVGPAQAKTSEGRGSNQDVEWSQVALKKSGSKSMGNGAVSRGGTGGAALQNQSNRHQDQHRSNTQPGEWEQGDWVCSGCRWINFKKRDTCLKCGMHVSPENFEQALPFVQPGDSKKHVGLQAQAALGSKEKPRWCELCKVECPGEISFNEHCAGKKHLAKVRQSRQFNQGRSTSRVLKPEDAVIQLPRPRPVDEMSMAAQWERLADPYKPAAPNSTAEPTFTANFVSQKMTFAEALKQQNNKETPGAVPDEKCGAAPVTQTATGQGSPETSITPLVPGSDTGSIALGAFQREPGTANSLSGSPEPWIGGPAAGGMSLWAGDLGLPAQKTEQAAFTRPAGLWGDGKDAEVSPQMGGWTAYSNDSAQKTEPGASAATVAARWGGDSPQEGKPQEADNIWKSPDSGGGWSTYSNGPEEAAAPRHCWGGSQFEDAKMQQAAASSEVLSPATAADAQDSGEGHSSPPLEPKTEEGRAEQHGHQHQQQTQMFHQQQRVQQQAQMQQAQMQQQGPTQDSGLWAGQPPAAQHKQWVDGSGGVQGGGMGPSGNEIKHGIWDGTHPEAGADGQGIGRADGQQGIGRIVNWDEASKEMGYAQTNEGLVVFIHYRQISSGIVPGLGQQVRWQTLQLDSNGNACALGVEVLPHENGAGGVGSEWVHHNVQGGQIGAAEMPWAGLQQHGVQSQHGGMGPDYSAKPYMPQPMYGQPQQVPQQGNWSQQVPQHGGLQQQQWDQQGHWKQQQQQQWAPAGAYGQHGFGRAFAQPNAGSYWGTQGLRHLVGAPPAGNMKLNSQFHQGSVWSNNQAPTTMPWGGGGSGGH